MSEPFSSGRNAALACIPLRCNPHPRGSFAFAQWTYGHDFGTTVRGIIAMGNAQLALDKRQPKPLSDTQWDADREREGDAQ